MADTASLNQLVHDGVVDEVLQQLKSGKEADVFLVRKGEQILAAKLYKARNERNFKNNAGYTEGRTVRSSRDARAMAKGSRYGRQKQEEAWKHAEVDALYKLHAAGVRVPAPDIFYEGVLVMSLVVDAEGYPAPRLADVQLDAQQAALFYVDLLRQAGIMLTCGLIHGDLSPFNVLAAWDGPTIIDLPQVIDAAVNPQAEMFFRRDVRNLHQFFAQFAPELRRHPDGGADLWSRYKRGELFPGYVPDLASLREDAPIPTFKQHHGRGRRGGGRGPEVSYKGAPPQHRPHEPAKPQGAQAQAHPSHPRPNREQRPHPAPQHAGQQRPQNPGAQAHPSHPRPNREQRSHSAPQHAGQQKPSQQQGPQNPGAQAHPSHPRPNREQRPHSAPQHAGQQRPQQGPQNPGAPGRRRRRRGGRGRGRGGHGPGGPPAP